jgi:methoxymalonate biosynthesis acyl carrier protein
MDDSEKQLIRREILTLSARGQAPTDEENLFDSGFLDSLNFMKLLHFIEGNFKVSFQRTDLRLKNFSCLRTIVEIIDQRREPQK